MLAAVILSAGESARMGTPKALLLCGKKTFLEHLLEVTRHPHVGLTRVVLGAYAAEIRERVSLPDDVIVLNKDWKLGQLSSIQAAIRSLPEAATSGMLLCPVDVPLITANLLNTLIERFEAEGRKIIIPRYMGKRGHPVIFPAHLYAELLAAPLEVGARAVVRVHAPDIEEVDTEEEGVVLNLNDPETVRRVLPFSTDT